MMQTCLAAGEALAALGLVYAGAAVLWSEAKHHPVVVAAVAAALLRLGRERESGSSDMGG